jgi:hypothetical protein
MISPEDAWRIPRSPILGSLSGLPKKWIRCSQWNLTAVYWKEIMNLAILPLALTMLSGPQIMSAIIFVTSAKPV